jgi:nucleotide-binding universal stress UspA family protein
MSVFPARSVLIPVDLTAVSDHAWAWAKSLSAPGAAFETLFVYDMPAAPPFGFPAPPLPRSARKHLQARLHAAYPGSRVRIEEGDAAFRILSRAGGADLIVMGSHGRRGLELLVQASVCEMVVRDAAAPVLTVRGRPRRIESVLAPVNLTTYARRGFELAADAADALDARLVVLYVATEGEIHPNPGFVLEPMIARLPARLREKIRPTVLKRSGQPVKEILKESLRHGLVVLTAHRKAILSDFVLGTTAERVLRYSRVPVLTAPSGR